MGKQYTAEELNKMTSRDLSLIILTMQEQISRMNDNYEKLLEQLRIAAQYRFGRHTEKLDQFDEQYSLFDEAESAADDKAKEPVIHAKLKKFKAVAMEAASKVSKIKHKTQER